MVVQINDGTDFAFKEIDRLSRSHYRGLSAEALLASVETPLGRRQYARLLGVMLKEPFALSEARLPSTSTKAVIGLAWKDDGLLRKMAPGTWQFELMRALAQDKDGSPLSDADALSMLTYYKYESSLGKFLFESFRKRICGDADASKAVKAAVAAAKKAGVNITTPTTSHLSVGIASAVAVSIAGTMSASVKDIAAPVIGGITLLILQIGVDGFCAWSRQVIEEADGVEREG